MAAPKLRFKEFDGDWERIKLSQMGTFKNGINKDKEDFGHGVPFINLMDVFGKNSICQNTFDLVNASSKEIEAYSLKQGDVLFIRSSVKPEGVAETAVVLEDLDNTVYSGFLIRYRPSKDIDLHYKKYCFSTDFFRKNVLALSTTSANTNINQESLSLLNLDLPSKPEQTKIASFLSNVDEKISQLTQKHELLSQYKQGMMQKLFSQQIRFKADDGSEFGEWEETTIGKITSTISTGATPSTLKEEYWNGNIKWMSSGELNHRHVHDVEKTITELGFKSSSTKILPKHCVLIGLAGQGKTRGTVAINYIELCTNQSIAAIHPNPKVFDYRFIFFNLDMRYQELRALSTGDGGRGGLNLQIIKGVEIHLPCLEEQTKIANFLSAIDQKIEVVAQQIEQAKTWKKGLLQQMFV